MRPFICVAVCAFVQSHVVVALLTFPDNDAHSSSLLLFSIVLQSSLSKTCCGTASKYRWSLFRKHANHRNTCLRSASRFTSPKQCLLSESIIFFLSHSASLNRFIFVVRLPFVVMQVACNPYAGSTSLVAYATGTRLSVAQLDLKNNPPSLKDLKTFQLGTPTLAIAWYASFTSLAPAV